MTTIKGNEFLKTMLKKAGVEINQELDKVLGSDDFSNLDIPVSIADPIAKLISVENAKKHPDVVTPITAQLQGSIRKALWQDARDKVGKSKEEWDEFNKDKNSVVDEIRSYLDIVHSSVDIKVEKLNNSTVEEVKTQMEEKYGEEISVLKNSNAEYLNKFTSIKEEMKTKEKEWKNSLDEVHKTHFLTGIFNEFTFKEGPAKTDPNYRKFLFNQAYRRVNSKAVIRQDETGSWGAYSQDGVSAYMDERNNILTPKDLITQEIKDYIDPTGGKGGGGDPPPPPKPKPKIPQNQGYGVGPNRVI